MTIEKLFALFCFLPVAAVMAVRSLRYPGVELQAIVVNEWRMRWELKQEKKGWPTMYVSKARQRIILGWPDGTCEFLPTSHWDPVIQEPFLLLKDWEVGHMDPGAWFEHLSVSQAIEAYNEGLGQHEGKIDAESEGFVIETKPDTQRYAYKTLCYMVADTIEQAQAEWGIEAMTEEWEAERRVRFP